jgi:hypothetical protein
MFPSKTLRVRNWAALAICVVRVVVVTEVMKCFKSLTVSSASERTPGVEGHVHQFQGLIREGVGDPARPNIPKPSILRCASIVSLSVGAKLVSQRVPALLQPLLERWQPGNFECCRRPSVRHASLLRCFGVLCMQESPQVGLRLVVPNGTVHQVRSLGMNRMSVGIPENTARREGSLTRDAP